MSALGTSWPVFLGLTVVLIGGAGYLAGQALARGWRASWQLVPYALLLGCADRFLVFALFGGTLLTAAGYLVDTAVIGALMVFAYRLTRARMMVSQYPWLYERRGLFSWRAREEAGDARG